MSASLKLAVFISGRGSNLQSLIDACKEPNFPAQINVVFSNNPEAPGLDLARAAGIDVLSLSHKGFSERQDFEVAIDEALSAYDVDIICLAGFMRILSPYFIGKWAGKMINIHPSLLPLYKGLHSHERAIEAGDKESGCTIHYVVPEMDSGPIILQKTVPILEGDTPDTLAARVLEQEHLAYPAAIKMIAEKHT